MAIAYLIHISKEGIFTENELTQKITPIETSDKNQCFQIVEKNDHFELLSLTSNSYFIHQGKKKYTLDLPSYDVFTIQDSTFIFSKKPFRSKGKEKETSSILEHYQTFYRFTEAISHIHNSSDILKKVLKLIVNFSKADKGFLLSLDKNLKIVATHAIDETKVQNSLSDLSKTVIQKVQDSKAPLIIDNVLDSINLKKSESIYKLELYSIACFPLLIRNECKGFLYLGSHTAEGFFDPLTVQVIQVFLSQVSLILENALLIKKLEKEKEVLQEKLENTKIVGNSAAMEDIFKKIEKIAPLDLSVLILGETGTGKELIAREIHRQSPKKDNPFIAINCGAIPENLLESILFGHKKGAFTGATEDQIGKFEAAQGGTIFLDEIAEMPIKLQVKLLRVLQERVIERVGDIREISIQIRVISATHQNVEKMISEGKFREDLYYRLNEVYLEIPPLRKRDGDILLLANFFLEKYKDVLGTSAKKLSKEAQEKLLHYSWPGNIRELENVMKRSLVFSNDEFIFPEHIEIKSSTSKELLPLREAENTFKRDYVNKVLALYDGDKDKAAQALGVSVRTLFRIE